MFFYTIFDNKELISVIKYRYGKRCRYAHGKEELRPISRSNQYKTKTCKAYHEGGTCPYGIRCTFIHHTNDKPINLDSSTTTTNTTTTNGSHGRRENNNISNTVATMMNYLSPAVDPLPGIDSSTFLSSLSANGGGSSSSSSRLLPLVTSSPPAATAVPTTTSQASPTTQASPFMNNGIWGSKLGLSNFYNPVPLQQLAMTKKYTGSPSPPPHPPSNTANQSFYNGVSSSFYYPY